MEMKYRKSTQFALRAKIFGFILQCLVFTLVLISYINQQAIQIDIYSDWNKNPILKFTILDSDEAECPDGTEKLLNYKLPDTLEGCYCGDENFDDSTRFFDKQCIDSQIKNLCTEIQPITDMVVTLWPNQTFCGIVSNSTYAELYDDCQNCTNGSTSCPTECPYTQYDSPIFDFVIDYQEGICYKNLNQILGNYPLLFANYLCTEYDWHYEKINNVTQNQLFELNKFDLSTLIGYDYYEEGFQNFSLFAKKFSIYNCSLPRLDVPSYRDTEIQNTNLIAIIIGGCLPGIGAISMATILQKLFKKGIFKTKSYKVSYQFYIPQMIIIVFQIITLSCIVALTYFCQSLTLQIEEYINQKCTDRSSLKDLQQLKDQVKQKLLNVVIGALCICLVSVILEIFLFCNFDRKIEEQPKSPDLQSNQHMNSDLSNKKPVFTIGNLPDDQSEKNVLDPEQIAFSAKNVLFNVIYFIGKAQDIQFMILYQKEQYQLYFMHQLYQQNVFLSNNGSMISTHQKKLVTLECERPKRCSSHLETSQEFNRKTRDSTTVSDYQSCTDTQGKRLLREELRITKQLLDKRSVELQRLQEENKKLSQANEYMKEELQDYKYDLKKVSRERDDYREELQFKLKKIELLNDEILRLQKSEQSMVIDLKDARDAVSNIKQYEQEIKQKEKQLLLDWQKLEKDKVSLKDKQLQLQQVEQQLSEQTQQIIALRSRLDIQEKKLAENSEYQTIKLTNYEQKLSQKEKILNMKEYTLEQQSMTESNQLGQSLLSNDDIWKRKVQQEYKSIQEVQQKLKIIK
ncbi:hypothetical protein pb186bvf_003942 [Paramecium bursaria]